MNVEKSALACSSHARGWSWNGIAKDSVEFCLCVPPSVFRPLATGRQGALQSVFKQSAIARAWIAIDRFLTGGESSVYRLAARFIEAAAVGDLLAGSGPREAFFACRPGPEAPLDRVLEGMLLPRASLDREAPVWPGRTSGSRMPLPGTATMSFSSASALPSEDTTRVLA